MGLRIAADKRESLLLLLLLLVADKHKSLCTAKVWCIGTMGVGYVVYGRTRSPRLYASFQHRQPWHDRLQRWTSDGGRVVLVGHHVHGLAGDDFRLLTIVLLL